MVAAKYQIENNRLTIFRRSRKVDLVQQVHERRLMAKRRELIDGREVNVGSLLRMLGQAPGTAAA